MAFYNLGIRNRLRKLSPNALADLVRVWSDSDAVVVNWINRGPVKENWGDAVAPLLVGGLSGRRVFNDRDILRMHGHPVYTTIGSMLGTVRGKNIIVWGSGFVDSASTLKTKPAKICAVRGPLTRKALAVEGVDCPEVFGDPALLFSRIYRPNRPVNRELGVIPHFKERDLPIIKRLRAEGAHIIDICGGIEQVANEVAGCQRIISGSLHGMVLGDSYGIPSYWAKFSDRPFGDGFKFRDYLLGVGRKGDSLDVADSSVDEVCKRLEPYELAWDAEAFMAASPFPILPQG